MNLATELAAPGMDWLQENGFEFAPEVPRIVYGHEPYSIARTYYGPDAGKSILKVLRKLLETAIAEGNIELRLNSAVKSLLTKDNSVLGIELADGSKVLAKNTILASGGF